MSISLTGSLTTCRVNSGYANKIQSDRFENYNALLCPVWNGQDQYGRAVCVDSYVTKTAGCASAEDRVAVENYLRPSYAEFTALDAQGYLNPSALGTPVNTKENYQKQTELLRLQDSRKTAMQNGRTGIQLSNTNKQNGFGCPNGNCSNGFNPTGRQNLKEGYTDNRANRNFENRNNLSGISSWKSNCYGCSAGNR